MNARLSLLGAGLGALTVVAALLHVPGADNLGSPGLVRAFVLLLAAAAALYFAAIRVVLTDPRDASALAVVLAVALLLRLPPLLGPPFLSSDLYRYVWDGRVQLAGINPYRYVPADRALAALRDHAIFDHVNRRFYAPTIYPPAAQIMFRLVAAVSETALSAKVAAVACETLAVLALLLTLRAAGLPTSRVLIYAWNPLAAWSFAGNGHVDAEAAALIAAAIGARTARRDGWAGALLAGATLVKFLPAAIAPALWRGRWRLPATAVLVAVLLYLPFISVGPRRVLGFLGAYGGEEGLGNGRGLWLLAGLGDAIRLPRGAVAAYGVLVALVLASAALAVARRPAPADRRADTLHVAGGAGLLAGLTMLLLSPHYDWYFPFLAVFAALRPSRALVWMSTAPLVLILSPWHEFFAWPALVYVPAIVLFCRDELGGVRRHLTLSAPERTAP